MITTEELAEWKKVAEGSAVEFLKNLSTGGGGYIASPEVEFIVCAANNFTRLIEEVERLQRTIAREVTENDELGSEFVYVMALKDEVKRYREALEWYADGEQWRGPTGPYIPIYMDGGKRARKALENE